MFEVEQKDFSIREFELSDSKRLQQIAHNINVQAQKIEGFQPFYAFQTDMNSLFYKTELVRRADVFLAKAMQEKKVSPRSTYRMAVCDGEGKLVGNVTLDMLPVYEPDGRVMHGDLGYFIDPQAGRRGLMTKAVRHMLSVYFQTKDVLDVTIHPDNVYSQNLLSKFNARNIGLLRNSIYKGEPRLLFKISKEDFLTSLLPQQVLSCKINCSWRINQNQRG